MAQYRSHASDDNKIALKSASKNSNQRSWVSVRINEIEQYKMEPRHAWVAVRELNEMFSGHHRKFTVMKLKKSDGTLAKTDKENKTRATSGRASF